MPTSRGVKREWRTYYVVFQESNYHRPWHFWTWNRFEHCWIFFGVYLGPPGLLTHQSTIKVEPLSTFLDTDYWPCDPEDVADEFLKDEEVLDIVKIVLPLSTTVNWGLRGLITCVTQVKFIMGLGKWLIMTPQQLRRYLLRIGGKSLKRAGN